MIQKDLLVVRKYTHRGIIVFVEIDFQAETISLVDNSQNGLSMWSAKKYRFNERTVDFAKTWLRIFEAMSKATQAAIIELEASKEDKLANTAKAISEIGKANKPKGLKAAKLA